MRKAFLKRYNFNILLPDFHSSILPYYSCTLSTLSPALNTFFNGSSRIMLFHGNMINA